MSVTNDPRVQAVMAPWGGGSYLKTVAKNLETAKIAWVPQPERARMGDAWARALHEVYFKRLSAADALKRADGEINKTLKEAGIK
jgi:ABC-type glycerol-3-phosphate transport system substrate-binding protein